MINGNVRDLNFPLNRSQNPVVEGGDLSSPPSAIPAWSTSDANEPVTVTMTLSLNEFVALANTIDVGRDIAYGEQSIEIWKLWTRVVNTMGFCEEVANCINTSDAVKQALNSHSGTTNGGVPSGGDYGSGAGVLIPANVNSNNILATSPCQEDNMYAVAVAIVNFTFDAVIQLYEVIELAISPAELVAELSDNAPAVVTGAPASALDWGIWIQETAFDAFNVYDTLTKRTEIACDLFCIMVENGCSLSFDDIANYFYSKSPISVAGKTLQQILIDSVTVTIPDAVGTLSMATFFGLLALGSRAGGIRNVGGFMTRIFAFIDETNNNWTTDCDPCGEPLETCYSFLGGNQNGVTLGTGTMSFQSAGMRNTVGSAGAWRWSFQLPTSVSFNRVKVTWAMGTSSWNGNVTGSWIRYNYTDNTDEQYNVSWSPPFGGGTQELTYAVPQPDTNKVLQSVSFFWETNTASGNNGQFFTERICFSEV